MIFIFYRSLYCKLYVGSILLVNRMDDFCCVIYRLLMKCLSGYDTVRFIDRRSAYIKSVGSIVQGADGRGKAKMGVYTCYMSTHVTK